MKNILYLLTAAAIFSAPTVSAQIAAPVSSNPNVVLEPWTYTENFEDRELGAWASYPHWQDIAYNQEFRPNEMMPGDPNISVVQKVTAYTNVDAYAGAQKLLDMYLMPGAKLSFRYYLKSNTPSEFYKVRFAAGEYGKLEYTINNPERNKWVTASLSFNDLVAENPKIAGKQKVKIYALAFISKFPDADPAMPIYFGIDDISFSASRETAFRFNTPEMYKLPEYAQYIPKKHYYAGDNFVLSGQWPLDAKRVSMEILSFTDQAKSFYKADLIKNGSDWSIKPLKLAFPEGLYIGRLNALNASGNIASTEFTIHIAPKNMAGKHPRLMFDADEKKLLDAKIKQPEFAKVFDDIKKNAKIQRDKIPVNGLIFDLDQFPKENWLPTWSAWGDKIYNTGEALRLNARAYAFHGDREAGTYVKDVLVKLAGWPNWTHPWQTNRGRYSEHRTGSWAHRVAEAYDLTYDLMSAEESKLIRKAIMANIVDGAHRTYVYNDDITAATSNWLAMIMGGSLMNMAAVYADGPDTENLEPYFTGGIIKYYKFINRVVDQKDGAWGEGYGYNNYSFSNMAYSLPSLDNVFKVDLTAPLVGSYNEFIWGGLIKDKMWFEYGDSNGSMVPATFWSFLLEKRREPRLSWFYNFMKTAETYEDVIFNLKGIPQDSPFDENPVKVFREVGTTVFKSGWEKDDFSFVMRSGAFYNHQHLDQGSFWLADKGVIFIEERHLKNSTYYDDPIYQSNLIQPVGHSTVLINDNEQSQRTGDHLYHAPGFNDHAYIANFLDGKDAAFSSGNIGKLYFDKVKDLSRNVLFIKPRTLLMLDTAVPSEKDAKVTLLYQTAELEHIKAGKDVSNITKKGVTLNVMHLAPKAVETHAVETPHYLYTLQRERHLKKEGMLTISANTKNRQPLVMANLLTTEGSDGVSEVITEEGDGFVSGVTSGKKFAFSTKPGKIYQVDGMETDAAAITWSNERTFIALATSFKSKNGSQAMSSTIPLSFEISAEGIMYAAGSAAKLSISSARKPGSVLLNGKSVRNFTYDSAKKQISIDVQAGEGVIKVN
ncbi:Heparinase II/III-like protein [Daejeonella rubra]|uniref:Heparinase II/III-like protein n=1 Tax=Daejeonella rubra TaxID=990371 RepID=A0A1G9SKT2_9SPHI|nr:heparinase II/III family protein [Daejeonella rubra]SDM36031.1 Heparinase II/III-like protein [Daejeonella rubra]